MSPQEESARAISAWLGDDELSPEEGVVAMLDMGGSAKNPRPTASRRNVYTVLTCDSRWAGRLRFNEFAWRVMYDEEALADHDATRISIWLDQVYELRNVNTALIIEVVNLIAVEHRTHPVREWLESLVWDGKPRISTWLSDYLRVDDTPLHRAIARRFLVAAVSRAMSPPCKVDSCLVLVGEQGANKSTAIKVLAGEPWFNDTVIDLGSKDRFQALDGTWIYEMQEMQSFKGRDARAVKGFMTSTTDHYRPPFGRSMIDRPRGVVFVGTTNEDDFLDDPTGSRRFWCVTVRGMVDIAGLESAREQLWAEAVCAWLQNEPVCLAPEEEKQLARANEAFESTDAWAEAIGDWCVGRVQVSVMSVAMGALQMPAREISKGDEMRITKILRRLNFIRHRMPDRVVWRRQS